MPNSEGSARALKISVKFKRLYEDWKTLALSASQSIKSSKSTASKYIKSMKINKKKLQDVSKDKKRIKSQEIILRDREIRFGKSLDKIKGLWQESLVDMESSIKIQKDALARINQEYLNAIKKIEIEINDVLQVPPVPGLPLEKIASKKSSSRFSNPRASDDDFISNRSAFSIHTEDISSFRSLSSRKKVKNSKVQNRDEKAAEKSQEVKKEESVSLQEIKDALFILKKANLINNSGNSQLLKIADMIKNPDNTSNVELMLQLIEIENKKNREKKDRNRMSVGKRKFRLKKRADELDDTSREKFKFSEEKSFNRTLLSNENLLSPKNNDEGGDAGEKEELHDVKLEELLGVASLIEELGLVSADNSMLNDIGFEEETKREKEIFNFYDEVPVKISKRNG